MTDSSEAIVSTLFQDGVPDPKAWPRLPRLISIVAPVFREEHSITLFADTLIGVMRQLRLPYEIIFVEDDSPDRSREKLEELHERYPDIVKVLLLSRRFGHQPSLAAGFQHATGDVVICLDSDLQHPPTLIPRLLHQWSLGNQLVYTRRRSQKDRGFLKEYASNLFYRLMNWLSDVPFEPGIADFRLMDEVVVKAINLFGERNPFFRGLLNWAGFQRAVVEYDAHDRAAGESSYSWKQMFKLAFESLFSFSLLPLRVTFCTGALLMGFCFAYGLWSAAGKLLGWYNVPGYSSIVLLISFVGGMNVLCLGVVAEYVGRIHEQVKGRPLYLVKESMGFEESGGQLVRPARESAVGRVGHA